MIERKMLVDMFDSMRDNGIDTDQSLLWGYFFADHDPSKLEGVVPELEQSGYRFVDIFGSDEDEDEGSCYFLHVEMVEQHSVDTLDRRNRELHQFAVKSGLESYDGMDVGRPDGQPLA